MHDSYPRIVVDLEKLRHINCGLGRFCLYLGQELVTASRGKFEPVFFLPPGGTRHFASGGFERIVAAPWKKEAFRRLLRPFVQPLLAAPRIALWHVTNQMSKYLPLDARIPVLLTIHDLNFLHDEVGCVSQPPLPSRERRKLAAVQRLVDRATVVTTISEYVARQLREFLDLGNRPLHVIPNGLAHPPPPASVRPAFLPADPFILTVGNCLPHKNFHALLGLVERLPGRRLVIAGKKTTPYGLFLAAEIARRRLEERVTMPGEVNDADLQWLYRHCEAFVFPSLAEGFGFPVLEAMQAGRPVFMTRATSLPEVGKEHGFYFDSLAPERLLAAYTAGLRAFTSDPEFASRARAHAATYSWRNAADAYSRVYLSIVG